MLDRYLPLLEELLRETFEGARPGQGTEYLDRDGGLRQTLGGLTAEQASRRIRGRPSIAAHSRHMEFHLRTVSEWIQGQRHKRDWPASFEPQTVDETEWLALRERLEYARQEFLHLVSGMSEEHLLEEGAGLGALAHLAYHLGAIRQLLHDVKSEPAFKPAGYNSLSPYLVVKDARGLIDFLARAFGAVPLRRYDRPDGSVMHAEVRIDDTVVMVGESGSGWDPQPVHVHIYVPDAAAAFRTAVEAGGKPLQEPVRKDGDPDLRGGVQDPYGNGWWVSTQLG